MQPLTSAQRKQLRSLAHKLKPLVILGKQGVTETLIASVNTNLEAHELIKLRFNDHKGEKMALSQEIASGTNSEVAGIIGHVLILYRQHEDPEKQQIKLRQDEDRS